MLTKSLLAIQAARPGLPTIPRAIVEAICLAEGPIGSSENVARALGLRNRYELARLLARARLPSLHRMAQWATVLSWVHTAERDCVSLSWMALQAGRYPGACYRQVKDVTGLAWEEVKARGSDWVQQEFLREVRGAQPEQSLSRTTAAPAAINGWRRNSRAQVTRQSANVIGS